MVKRIILCAIIALFSVEAGAQSARSNQLFDEGVELYRQGKYREAIPYFEQVDVLDRKELPEGNPRREYATLWLASCYYKLGNEAKARELDATTYAVPPIDRRLTVQSDSLSVLAQEYINAGDYERAIPIIRQCAALEKKALGANSVWYANSLSLYADCLQYADYYLEEMLQAIDEPLAIYTNNNIYSRKADMCFLKGHVYSSAGYNEDAIQAFKQASEAYLKVGDELNAMVAIEAIAECENLLGKYEESLKLVQRAVPVIAQSPYAGKESFIYAVTLSTAAISYSNQGRFEDAYRLAKEAKDIFNIQEDSTSIYYCCNLICYAISAAKTDKSDAPSLVKETKTLMEAINWTNSSDFAFLLQFYLRQNISNMSEKEALAMIKNIMDTYIITTGLGSASYLNALFDIADIAIKFVMKGDGLDLIWQYMADAEPKVTASQQLNGTYKVNLYYHMGAFASVFYSRFEEGINYLLQGKNAAIENGLENTSLYCKILTSLGQAYANIGKNEEALLIYLQEKSIYEKELLPKDDNYITLLANIYLYYANIGDNSNAEIILSLAKKERGNADCINSSAWFVLAFNDAILSIRKNESKNVMDEKINALLETCENFGTLRNLHYPYALTLVATNFIMNERYQEAQYYMEQAVNAMKSMFNANSPNLLIYQGILAQFYKENGNLTKALSTINEAISQGAQQVNLNPQMYTQLLDARISIKMAMNKVNETIDDAKEITKLITDMMSNNFRSMTYRERTLFWNQYSAWFTYTLPGLLQLNRSDELLPSAYNSMLLSKGLLLNSEVEVGKLIAEKGNEDAWKLYEDIQFHRARLTKLAQNCGNGAEYDQLNRQIQRMEKQLMQISKEYGDYTQKLTITWEDVKRHLSPGEVAIEFVQTPYLNKDRTYIALVVKPEYDCPHRVDLCQESQISGIAPADLYNTADLWSCVWQPLSDELEGVKRIYFSPAGQLYSTAIEYAAMPDGDVMNNRYEMYRLSSTREVALQEAKTSELDAVVYGGLEFDADYQTLAEVNDEQKGLDVFRPRALVNNLEDLRGGVANLPGTEREAQDIVQLFSNTRRQCHLFDGLNGTEESFKWLSGARKNVLHIATHGFYWKDTDETSPVANLESFLQLENMPTIPAEDKMLSRNGLLFAGANVALRNGEVPDGRDDGILTALELSGLDFRGLDLVVLSACQTGLGEVTGEGVFGLQRGFKKAGAQTLMMSLWKVDDQATRLLMTEFYRNLLDGKSKRIAFNNAQQYLRTVENGKYNLPRYWAAFILLDGI